jgi:spoIIIJ-associated protein
MKDEQILKTAKELTNDFLIQMGLDAEIKTSFNEDPEKEDVRYLSVELEGENLNELIGHHGRNLESAQVVLGLMLTKKIEDKSVRLVLDINNYKVSREKYLQSYALRAADQVRESGQELELMPMKPSERRIVHMVLKEEKGIETESKGEGEDRRVVIRKSK